MWSSALDCPYYCKWFLWPGILHHPDGTFELRLLLLFGTCRTTICSKSLCDVPFVWNSNVSLTTWVMCHILIWFRYNELGYEWSSSLLAFLSLLLIPIPFIYFYKGETLRWRSPWARCVNFRRDWLDIRYWHKIKGTFRSERRQALKCVLQSRKDRLELIGRGLFGYYQQGDGIRPDTFRYYRIVSQVHFTNGRLVWQIPIPYLLTKLKYRQGYKYPREIDPIWIEIPSLHLF
jgi:hypothetical protein